MLKSLASTVSGGFAFQITNAEWTNTYGWSETIEAVDTEYPLSNPAAGNAWTSLAPATYDVYFNPTAKTVKFCLSALTIRKLTAL